MNNEPKKASAAVAHTPTPWRVVRHKTGYSVRAGQGDESFDVANTGLLNLSDEENEANAHLIAAAPELLAALENIARCTMEPNIRDEARAAIAKAKGAAK